MPDTHLESWLHLKHEPFTLAILTGLAVILFLFVTGLSHMYHAKQESLAKQWSAHGATYLHAQNFPAAVEDFRTALLYSSGNYSYQFNLAEALLGEGRIDEAKTYLISLWSRQPDDGLINLELARIAVRQGETEKALRYYHNAIYATWPSKGEVERRNARLELVNFLLRIGANADAQSELIALAANVGYDPAEQARIGDLFVEAGDYRQALAEYRLSLRDGRRAPQVLAGAGRAAFELSEYSEARQYLQEAVADSPGDTASAALLKTAEMVLEMDPFRRQITVRERNRIVVNAFAAAGERLKFCQSHSTSAVSTAQPDLAGEWGNLKPRITEQGLRRNPDLVNSAMELVFSIERQTSSSCESPTETDSALLRVANLHEGR